MPRPARPAAPGPGPGGVPPTPGMLALEPVVGVLTARTHCVAAYMSTFTSSMNYAPVNPLCVFVSSSSVQLASRRGCHDAPAMPALDGAAHPIGFWGAAAMGFGTGFWSGGHGFWNWVLERRPWVLELGFGAAAMGFSSGGDESRSCVASSAGSRATVVGLCAGSTK
jgi:hypothetical protein